MKPATTQKITLTVLIRRTIHLVALAALALLCTGAVAAPNHGLKNHPAKTGRDMTVVSTQPGGAWNSMPPVSTGASGFREDAWRDHGHRARPIPEHRIIKVQPGGAIHHPLPNETMDAFMTPKGHPRHALPITLPDFPTLRFQGRTFDVTTTDALSLAFNADERAAAQARAFRGHLLGGVADGPDRSTYPTRFGRGHDAVVVAEGPSHLAPPPRSIGGKPMYADEIESGNGTAHRIGGSRLVEENDQPTAGGGTSVDMDTDDVIPPVPVSRTPLSGAAPGSSRPGWLKDARMEIGGDGNGGLQATAGWTVNFR